MTIADNQQERLKTWWIVGFTDGEGCFSVSILRNHTTKSGYQVFPEFVITQGEKSRKALEKIQKFFECGKIFVNHRKDNHREPLYRYCVRSFKDIHEIIIPFFKKFPLQTAKSEDFKMFCKILELMKSKKHIKLSGLRKIQTIMNGMNRRKSSQRFENPQRLYVRSFSPKRKDKVRALWRHKE